MQSTIDWHKILDCRVLNKEVWGKASVLSQHLCLVKLLSLLGLHQGNVHRHQSWSFDLKHSGRREQSSYFFYPETDKSLPQLTKYFDIAIDEYYTITSSV